MTIPHIVDGTSQCAIFWPDRVYVKTFDETLVYGLCKPLDDVPTEVQVSTTYLLTTEYVSTTDLEDDIAGKCSIINDMANRKHNLACLLTGGIGYTNTCPVIETAKLQYHIQENKIHPQLVPCRERACHQLVPHHCWDSKEPNLSLAERLHCIRPCPLQRSSTV